MDRDSDKGARLQELKATLIRKGLLDPEEDLIVEMLEDLVHFAYFTGCITKSGVKRLLALSENETKAIIKSWKRWNEGNRSCGLSRNPFSEEWTITKEKEANSR